MKRAFCLLVLLAAVGGTGCAGNGQNCASGNCGPGGPGGGGGGHTCGKRGLLESLSGGMHGGGAACAACAGGGGGYGGEPQAMPMQAPPNSPGAVAYPYYTNRGPRDFLQANPPSIGPY